MRISTLLLFGITAAGIASAQQPPALNGPVEGYLFDSPTRSVRAVTGVPGAAIFSPSLSDGLDLGSVAPHRNYAIAFQSGKCLLLSGLDSGPPSASVLSGIVAQPDDIVWSPDGSTALLYSRSGNWIQPVTGFPDAPEPGTYQDVASLGGNLSAIATDSHGGRIAVAMEGTTGGVYLASGGQSFVPVSGSSHVVALTFSADGNTLYVLDRGARGSLPQLAAVDLGTLGFQTLPLDGLAEPLAMQPTQDAQGRAVIYVASGRDQKLRVIDLASGQVLTDVPLSLRPTGISSFGRASFLLRSRFRSYEPLWLFASAPDPAVYFVPAIQAPAGLQ